MRKADRKQTQMQLYIRAKGILEEKQYIYKGWAAYDNIIALKIKLWQPMTS